LNLYSPEDVLRISKTLIKLKKLERSTWIAFLIPLKMEKNYKIFFLPENKFNLIYLSGELIAQCAVFCFDDGINGNDSVHDYT